MGRLPANTLLLEPWELIREVEAAEAKLAFDGLLKLLLLLQQGVDFALLLLISEYQLLKLFWGVLFHLVFVAARMRSNRTIIIKVIERWWTSW